MNSGHSLPHERVTAPHTGVWRERDSLHSLHLGRWRLEVTSARGAWWDYLSAPSHFDISLHGKIRNIWANVMAFFLSAPCPNYCFACLLSQPHDWRFNFPEAGSCHAVSRWSGQYFFCWHNMNAFRFLPLSWSINSQVIFYDGLRSGHCLSDSAVLWLEWCDSDWWDGSPKAYSFSYLGTVGNLQF